MKTTCTGWLQPHDLKVVGDDGVDDGKTDPGVCLACERQLRGELDPEEERQAAEYAAYLKNPLLDPRD